MGPLTTAAVRVSLSASVSLLKTPLAAETERVWLKTVL
jgi:hypothetical protein